MPLRLSERFDSFVEFFIFLLRFLLFKFLDLVLLLQKLLLNSLHMLVGLKHFGEKVIGSADRHFGLNQDLHSFHNILPRCVVKSHLPLNVVVHLKRLGTLWNLNFLWIRYAKMLCEWNFTMFFNQLLRFKSVVKVLPNFMKSLSNLILIINCSLPKFLKPISFKLLLIHCSKIRFFLVIFIIWVIILLIFF